MRINGSILSKVLIIKLMESLQNPKLMMEISQNNMQMEVMQKFGLKRLPYSYVIPLKKSKNDHLLYTT
jgi:hypothetical protein